MAQDCYSINPEIKQWLKDYAKKTNRKKSKLVEMALIRFKAWIEAQEEELEYDE